MAYLEKNNYRTNIDREEHRKWVNSIIKENSDLQYYQATLTFIQRKYESGQYLQVKYDIEKIMKRFINRLNREVFGNAAYRHKKCIFSYVSIECGVYGNNTHAHLILGFPNDRVYKKSIDALISETIEKTPMINKHNEVGILKTDIERHHWSNYILKEGFNPLLMNLPKY
jgi:hypothetical protein